MLDAKDLMPNEKLVIARMRNGFKQHDMAKLFEVSQSYYSNMERGRFPLSADALGFVALHPVSELRFGEKLFVDRRRRGTNEKNDAENIGISYSTLVKVCKNL